MEKYTRKVDAFLEPYLVKEGYVLIKSEFVEEDHNYYLRVYIDLSEEAAEKRRAEIEAAKAAEAEAEAAAEKNEEETQAGIGINDCVKVSRRLSQWLDKEDFIKEAYTLEVCSRGFLNPANEEPLEV